MNRLKFYIKIGFRSLGWSITLTIVVLSSLLIVWLGYGGHVYSVQTGSMRPNIQIGDAIVVRKQALKVLKAGDSISYKTDLNGKTIITHRIVTIDAVRRQIVTKGDNLEIADQPIQYSQITGKVVTVLPGWGRVINMAHHTIWMLIGAYLVFSVVLILEVNRFARKYRYPYRLPR